MSTEMLTIVAIISIIIWITVSKEAVKHSEKVNWRKMIILLFAGTLSTGLLLMAFF